MSRGAVHPFPARMAPEIAEDAVSKLPKDAVILDPMMGSGTFPIAALKSGRATIGLDSDPLALVIATTGAGLFDKTKLVEAGRRVARHSRLWQPWMPEDEETERFIAYWFDEAAADRLGRLAMAIWKEPDDLRSPLWCAFSRLIITKDAGASRARDAAHSRPHRVRDMATIDPIARYEESVAVVLNRVLSIQHGVPRASFGIGDARHLELPDKSVDAVMTSPPYLAAIDYLRGHRLSLVWMGYSIGALRELRGSNVGTERQASDQSGVQLAADIATRLSKRGQGMLKRYVADLNALATEAVRVVKPGGTITWVLSDASLEGSAIPISRFAESALTGAGATFASAITRKIPARSRYLPPPEATTSALSGRMRQESILTFAA